MLLFVQKQAYLKVFLTLNGKTSRINLIYISDNNVIEKSTI